LGAVFAYHSRLDSHSAIYSTLISTAVDLWE